MYFFLNRFQKLSNEKAESCKEIYNKLDAKNQERLISKGNLTANVMGGIYCFVTVLFVAFAVVSFICKYWWFGTFFVAFSVLLAYLAYSGFSWRKREGFEYAKLFGEEIIYMLGQQERDKMKKEATVDVVLEKVALEDFKNVKKSAKSKKSEEKTDDIKIDIEDIKPVENVSKDSTKKNTKRAVKPVKTSKEEKTVAKKLAPKLASEKSTKTAAKKEKTAKVEKPAKVGKTAETEKPVEAKKSTKSTAKKSTTTVSKNPRKKTTK